MNKKNYEKTVTFFSENKTANILLKIIYQYLPFVMFAAYPALLIYTLLTQGFGRHLAKLTLVPLGVLIFVTALRKIINAERPYEKYGMNSVFNKQTKGQSMPSRHTASAFIIAMTFLYVNIPLGIAATAVAVLIAVSRVQAGAHFIRDVAAGAAIGIAAGMVFYLIP